MTKNNLNRVVIVGGGSAGWMTAAALSNTLGKQLTITLIESEQIGTVGVGEATIPEIASFNQALGIDETEFLQATQGTFKLGIEFRNWGGIGDSYFHPFGSYGFQLDSIQFYHHWQKHFIAGGQFDISDFSICVQAAKHNKFLPPNNKPNTPLSQIAYAYHFDASLYAKFLRNYAEKRGVIRLEAIVDDIELKKTNDIEDGYINALKLNNGDIIAGDLFIDCTGFRARLIHQALNVGFQDWSELLPCDSAVTVATKSTSSPTPYTRSTAHSAGWQWRIPLQHRVGNGHVYSSKYMSQEEATKILLTNLDGEIIGEPRHLHFTTGMRDKFWHKNCVAIGLSSGFMEPLESTSLHLIQASISKLIGLFPTNRIELFEVEQYNQMLTEEFVYIRDFLVLHYHLTKRNDSDFWLYCQNMKIPNTLKTKLELYRNAGRIFESDADIFSEESWLAVMHGQGLKAKNNHPAADVRPLEVIDRQLAKIKDVIDKTVKQMPEHLDYINKRQRTPS